ncbi:uncharacterized protein LOC142771379 [Rhipicephalus microplus]|uniref:uncharacterized protein LOC142771379 n=1 Tax=Rhipicephalus microplus TaxID=6941 RepID=UPI003F6B7174
MVLFAARHRRRLLNEDSLIVDSEDRDGVKGEAALREASRRKRNEDASATRSRTTRRKLATGVAIAGRRARDSVVPISKKITVPWTLSQPSSGKLHRKVAGDPREGELGWNREKRATNANMGHRTDGRRHWEPVTTVGETAPDIFLSKSTPHQMLPNSTTLTARTTAEPTTSASSFKTTQTPANVAPNVSQEHPTQTSRDRPGTSLVAASSFRGEASAGRDRPTSPVPLDVRITERTVTPHSDTIFQASVAPVDAKKGGVSNPSLTFIPTTTRSDLQISTVLETSSLRSASAPSNRVAKPSSLDGIEAHTEPFPDDALNYSP